MEVLGKVGLNATGKALSTQTKRWKTQVSKGSEITKKILSVSGVKKEQSCQDKLPTENKPRSKVSVSLILKSIDPFSLRLSESIMETCSVVLTFE